MSDEKKKRIETRNIEGSWDVGYKWNFNAAMTKRYLDGLKQRKILGTKCSKCGRIYTPPSPFCGRCFEELDNFVEVKDTGTVVMYTVLESTIAGATREKLEEPKITAMIRFDGSDSWTLGPVANVTKDKIKNGMKVKVAWKEKPEGMLSDIQHFEPL